MRQRVISESSRTSTTTPDGRPIIAREYNALAPHPAPAQSGRMVSSKGINKILVDPGEAGTDAEQQAGVELYECDPCGWTANNTISVRAHLASHNPAKTEPDYDVRTMRALVATVLKYKRAGVRNYCEHAAAELNTVGVKRRDGQPWRADNVSRLYREWMDRPEVKRSRSVKAVEAGVSAVSEEKVTSTPNGRRPSSTSPQVSPSLDGKSDHPVAVKLSQLADTLAKCAMTVADVAREIAAWPILADSAEDVELLRAKAAHYDQIAGALRGIGDLPR